MKALHAKNPAAYTVAELCGLFGKSKQAYYKHDWDTDLRSISQEEFAQQFIRAVRDKDPGIGGVKIWIMYCNEFGVSDRIGRDRFLDIFDRLGLKLRRRRHKPRTTDSSHGNPLYPNIIKDIIPMRLGEIIVGDITYFPIYPKHGSSDAGTRVFAYINLLMDSRTKIVIGRSVALTLEARYTIEALIQGIETLESLGVDCSGTIHHSDRGVQYTSFGYIEVLRSKHMGISMTESGNPKDNAEAERINNTIKNELLKDMAFHSLEELVDALDKAIDFYNNERPHASLGMLTPVAAAGVSGRFKRYWRSYREEAIDRKNMENEVGLAAV